MWNQLMGTRILRLTVFVVTTAMLTAVVSVPAGAEDKTISKSELKKLIANPETKADHERIAQYFDAEATKYEAEAKDHAELAQLYQKAAFSPPSTAKLSASRCNMLPKTPVNSLPNTGEWPIRRTSELALRLSRRGHNLTPNNGEPPAWVTNRPLPVPYASSQVVFGKAAKIHRQQRALK